MFKFNELEYSRPDLSEVRAELEDYIEKFKSAKTFAEADKLFYEHCKKQERFETMLTLARIRNSADMNDKFYEAETNFFNEELPQLAVDESRADKLLISSPFRADFERKYGADMLKNIEAQVRLADERIVPEQVEEAKLCQQYSKTAGCASVKFRGEDCNFYGLLKHMESRDRAERQEAFIAWANLYESISGELDEIYTKLVSLRKTMAQKLGFKNYVEMAYLANGHYYYDADDVAEFRKQVVEEVVPVAAELCEKQKARLGADRFCYYDEFLNYPEGNAVPIGDGDYLIEKAREMYTEMSKETGEFFDFMVGHGLFDLQTRTGKQQGGYCTFLPEYKAPFIFSNSISHFP